MPEGTPINKQEEASDVIQALESAYFRLDRFNEWLGTNGFQTYDVGKYFSYRGSHGYVQLEFAVLGDVSRVIQCTYIPYTDTDSGYALVTEGVSASGHSLSSEDLEHLKLHRFEQVERIVTSTIGDETGQHVKPQMKLRDDLDLDEDIDIPSIVMQLEDEFDCIISDEDAERFETVEDVISFIREAKGISA